MLIFSLFFFLRLATSSLALFAGPGLNFTSSAPHIFASTFGLLGQWSNTFWPYGHSIAPCEIPINTLLYHARIDGDLPPKVEWLGFDWAMSYAIAGRLATSRMLTYKTTENIKCMYFDGSSAALNAEGNMDTQMVFIYNNSAAVPDEPLFGPRPPSNNRTSGDPNGPMLGAEYDRAEALCAYIKDKGLGGPGWGVQAVLRTNAAWEAIFCQMTDSPSIRLVSHLHSSAPSFDYKERDFADALKSQGSQNTISDVTKRPQRPNVAPFEKASTLGWFMAASNQYGFAGGTPGRGEVRVKADSCNIFSFYDPQLADQEHARMLYDIKMLNLSSTGSWLGPQDPSERTHALQQLTRRRRLHRVMNVSVEDGVYMRSAVENRLRAFLEPTKDMCSGMDWHQTTQDIVMAFSNSLHDFLDLLQEPAGKDTLEWLGPRRELAHMMMMAYFEYPPAPMIQKSPREAFSMDSQQAKETYARCREQYAISQLADSEILIDSAIHEVLSTICRTVLSIFLSIETEWYTISLSGERLSGDAESTELEKGRIVWRQEVEETMAWLGWADQWAACDPGCGPGHVCYIPMWPLSFLGGGGHGRRPRPYGYGPGDGSHGPGYGYGPGRGHGPPGGGRFGEDDKLLWQPRCINRTEMLV